MTTGEEAPRDKKDDVPNLRLEFLEKLRGIAKDAFATLGVMDNVLEAPPAGERVTTFDLLSSNGWVNSPDTWTCKLADSENDIVKSNVNAVDAAARSLLSGIDSEISNIYANDRATVPKGDPDAVWSRF
jgi:hypothetical protein